MGNRTNMTFTEISINRSKFKQQQKKHIPDIEEKYFIK